MSSSSFSSLSRSAITGVLQSGRHLLVQGAMGLHSSDGLAGKVAAARSGLFACVGTVSGVGKTPEMLRGELRRAMREAPGGFVGVNLMAAIKHEDFASTPTSWASWAASSSGVQAVRCQPKSCGEELI